MNFQFKFGYFMTTQSLNTKVFHFLCKWDGIKDKQTDGQTGSTSVNDVSSG